MKNFMEELDGIMRLLGWLDNVHSVPTVCSLIRALVMRCKEYSE
jgi:hypothetical protein